MQVLAAGDTLRLGRRKGMRLRVPTEADFDPLADWSTPPVHGVWASDPLWTPPADGAAVASWRNGGTVGGDLAQGTSSKQPAYRASTPAFGDRPTVQGDASNDYLSVTFSALSQPVWLVWLGSKSKAANANEAMAGGLFSFYTSTSNSQWKTFGSAAMNGGTADTNVHLVVAKSLTGASNSFLLVDESLIVTGNMGNLATSTKLSLFNDGSESAGYFSGGHCALCLVFTTNPRTQAEWPTFVEWVNSYYGRSVPVPVGTQINLVFDGDSITADTHGGGRTLSAHVGDNIVHASSTITNVAVGGQTLTSMLSDDETQVDPLYTASPQSIVVVWGGTNDLYGGTSGATAFGRFQSYCEARKAAGWTVVAVTAMPRSDVGTPGDFDTQRATFNESIRSGWQSWADALVDVAADARFGDETNTTYFHTDLVHLNNTGRDAVADMIVAELRQLAP